MAIVSNCCEQSLLRWFFNRPVHAPEGRSHHCNFHAHGLGTPGTDICHPAATLVCDGISGFCGD